MSVVSEGGLCLSQAKQQKGKDKDSAEEVQGTTGAVGRASNPVFGA